MQTSSQQYLEICQDKKVTLKKQMHIVKQKSPTEYQISEDNKLTHLIRKSFKILQIPESLKCFRFIQFNVFCN